MGLVRRLKCEKKLIVDDPDKKYETENDSDSAYSYSNNQNRNPAKATTRKESHQKSSYFKPSKLGIDTSDNRIKKLQKLDTNDEGRNNHKRDAALTLVSANMFADFLDKRCKVLEEINYLASGIPTTTATKCRKKNAAKQSSRNEATVAVTKQVKPSPAGNIDPTTECHKNIATNARVTGNKHNVPQEQPCGNHSKTIPATESPSDTTINSIAKLPEEYWQSKVHPRLTADQRDLLATSMFAHIWKTQGESVASKILEENDPKALHKVAAERFHNGCQLWTGADAEGALSEFEQSKRIREIQATQKSLLHVQYLQDRGNNKHKNKDNPGAEGGVESNAELFFALGMAHTEMLENNASLKEFRRAMQVAALGMGMDHELTKASTYMIRTTLGAMGESVYEIERKISELKTDLRREIEGDQLYEKGMRERALVEYANLKLLYDSDSLVQARIKTKMATIFEEKRDYSKALDLWADLLVLYEDDASIGLHHPLARHAMAKAVKVRRKIQLPWSEK